MYLPTVRRQDYTLRLLASKAFMKQSRCRTKYVSTSLIIKTSNIYHVHINYISADP